MENQGASYLEVRKFSKKKVDIWIVQSVMQYVKVWGQRKRLNVLEKGQ